MRNENMPDEVEEDDLLEQAWSLNPSAHAESAQPHGQMEPEGRQTAPPLSSSPQTTAHAPPELETAAAAQRLHSLLHGRIAFVAVGESSGDVSTRTLLGQLKALGAVCSPPRSIPPWAALDVTGTSRGDSLNAALVSKVCDILRSTICYDADCGVRLSIGRGILGHKMPFGAPVDEALRHHAEVRNGEIQLGASTHELLRDFGLPIASARYSLPARLRPVCPSLRPGASQNAFQPMYAGFVSRLLTVEARRIGVVRSYRVRSTGETVDGRQLSPGDTLQVEYGKADDCWLYVLLDQEDELTSPLGDSPLRTPEDPPDGQRQVPPAKRPGVFSPWLLATLAPLPSLLELLEHANAAARAGAVSALSCLQDLLLNEAQIEDFALIPTERYQLLS
jgi:hypothetical protein